MQKLKEVKANYEKKLKEYQMYYVESVIGDDRKYKNQMKKKCDSIIPHVKYAEAELHTMESVVDWLETSVKTFQESILYMENKSNDMDKVKKEYGSIRTYEDSYNKEMGQLIALQNLLTGLKS